MEKTKTTWNVIKCPQCSWMMRTPLANKMTNIDESLRIHHQFTHK